MNDGSVFPRERVLACPHCAAPLALSAERAVCAAGHSFDRARQGYLNLLVGGRIASSKVSGDTPEALAARRRFFAGAHYAPIADAVAGAVGAPEGVVLDIGCGEGWYLARLDAPERVGLDISRTAVRMSAVALPTALFVVASSYRMPVLSGSVDTVVSIFAPLPSAEVVRVLRPGGRLVTVGPGPGHLAELAPSAISESVTDQRRRERAARRELAPPAGRATRIRFSLALDADSALDLVQMTPLAWHGHARRAVVAGTRQVSVDVWVTVLGIDELAGR